MHKHGLMILVTTTLIAAVVAGRPAPAAKGLAKLRADADRLLPLAEHELARRFLSAAHADTLVAPGNRTLGYNKADREWRTFEEGLKLPVEERARYKPHECDEDFYFETRYGSPLVYSRVLDIAAAHGATLAPDPNAAPGLLDFGYGTIGHLLLTCTIGVESAGIDIDSLLPRLYARERDAGRIAVQDGSSAVGLHLLDGSWPSDESLAEHVRAVRPRGFDLITSKNTLKMGYIHPEMPVDPKKLVHLGVSDERFLAAVFERLSPGGLFVIYNISPRPSRGNEPYKPWGDGRCPFSREAFEGAGFEVLALDTVDDDAAEAIFKALDYPITDAGGEKDLFALYTVARRPAK